MDICNLYIGSILSSSLEEAKKRNHLSQFASTPQKYVHLFTLICLPIHAIVIPTMKTSMDVYSKRLIHSPSPPCPCFLHDN